MRFEVAGSQRYFGENMHTIIVSNVPADGGLERFVARASADYYGDVIMGTMNSDLPYTTVIGPWKLHRGWDYNQN